MKYLNYLLKVIQPSVSDKKEQLHEKKFKRLNQMYDYFDEQFSHFDLFQTKYAYSTYEMTNVRR